MSAPIIGTKLASIDYRDTTTAARLVGDDNWIAEQKYDGTRVMVRVDADGQHLYGWDGRPMRHAAAMQWAPSLLAKFPAASPLPLQIDGELLIADGRFVAFDILAVPLDGVAVHTLAWDVRRALLESACATLGLEVSAVAYDTASKLALIEGARDGGYEGVVLKDRTAACLPGKRPASQRKLKFYREADCIVTARDTDSACNASLAVYADGRLVPVGRCSMLGKPPVEVGDVVEIKYLYATASLTLYQPTLLRVRDDKTPAECSLDQLAATCKGVLDLAA